MVTFFIPTGADIDNLKVNSMAIDCYGRKSKVTEVSYRGVDANGRKFVGFYVSTGSGEMSHSLKEWKLARTLRATQNHSSHELDLIERDMLANGERTRD